MPEVIDSTLTHLATVAGVYPESLPFMSMFSADQYYTPYPDPRAANTSFPNTEDDWHLAGMDSEQIFAALMEGVSDSTLPHFGV